MSLRKSRIVITCFCKRTAMKRCPAIMDLFKDEMIMLTRLLSFAFVGVFAAVAQAQLPSERFSPINYFGRYHGFGYSDGYHACKGGRCNSWSLWKPWESMSKPWESMSSLYGSPSPATSNRAARLQATANLPMVSQEYYAAPINNQSIGFPSDPMLRRSSD